MQTAVVIPVGPDRLSNLLLVLESLERQTEKPRLVVLVCDGPNPALAMHGSFKLPTAVLETPKHQPGMEQPRNIGVRLVGDLGRQDPRFAGIDHVWFLDTDVIVRPRALEFYKQAHQSARKDDGESINRILVGPYDWLPPDVREPVQELRNDPEGVPPPGRWASFDEHDPDEVIFDNLSAGLACFSGNLVWPLSEFERVGGFWNELHHGRCEDGELGLRAVSMRVPISFVREARGWHLHHDRNPEWIMQANARDVPMLDERHPWVQGRCTCGHQKEDHETTPVGGCQKCACGEFQRAMFIVDEDGKRFNVRCPICGEEMNSALIWGHQSMHKEESGDSQPA